MSRRRRRPRSVHSCCVGCGIEPRNGHFAGAETVSTVERNMSNAGMRGTVRPAGVKGHITRRGSASEPGRSRVWPSPDEAGGPHREGEEPKPMMHGRGKSDEAIVAVKPTNKGGAIRRGVGGAKGRGQGECEPARHARNCAGSAWRSAGSHTAAREVRRKYPRWEPYAGKPHVRICAGGVRQRASLPRPRGVTRQLSAFGLAEDAFR